MRPIVFYSRKTGAVGGVMRSSLDAVKVRAQDLICHDEWPCLVLDAQTSRAIVVHASVAIGLEPSRYVLLEVRPFASLRVRAFGWRAAGRQVLRSLMVLAAWTVLFAGIFWLAGGAMGSVWFTAYLTSGALTLGAIFPQLAGLKRLPDAYHHEGNNDAVYRAEPAKVHHSGD